MEFLFLSRLQFAVATLFHFIFVPLTLGLSLLIAIIETRYVMTGDESYLQMAKFWGKMFLINFALGVVTGLTLEFQFGTNWGPFSIFVGNIFGPILAFETTSSFFLESVFLGIWIFGWNRVSKGFHAFCMWVVFVASTLSAYWIIVANAWMQHPVGYKMVEGKAVLNRFHGCFISGICDPAGASRPFRGVCPHRLFCHVDQCLPPPEETAHGLF